VTIAASSIAGSDTIRLPFGSARTSPIAARDVAEVIAAVLVDPTAHVGKTYELTGPRSQDMTAMATEYSAALGRPVTGRQPTSGRDWVANHATLFTWPAAGRMP
jgi:uncharacterized protein YbjT (DUF2867 family)